MKARRTPRFSEIYFFAFFCALSYDILLCINSCDIYSNIDHQPHFGGVYHAHNSVFICYARADQRAEKPAVQRRQEFAAFGELVYAK